MIKLVKSEMKKRHRTTSSATEGINWSVYLFTLGYFCHHNCSDVNFLLIRKRKKIHNMATLGKLKQGQAFLVTLPGLSIVLSV